MIAILRSNKYQLRGHLGYIHNELVILIDAVLPIKEFYEIPSHMDEESIPRNIHPNIFSHKTSQAEYLPDVIHVNGKTDATLIGNNINTAEKAEGATHFIRYSTA